MGWYGTAGRWVFLACSLLTTGCSTRSIIVDSQGLDHPGSPDHGSPAADQAPRPDAAPPSCDRACPPPTAGTICISGRVFEAVSLLKSAVDPTSSKIPARLVDAVSVGLYDPLALALDKDAKPLASKAVYNDGGCFILAAVSVSLEGVYTLAVDDKGSSGGDFWARTALDVRLGPLSNSAGHSVPAVRSITAAAWGNDLVDEGALLLWYRDAGGASLGGVTPTMNGSPPPWSAATCAGDCATFVLGEDCSGLVPGAAASNTTTRCGLVAVRAAPWAAFSGLASGKKVNVAKRGATAGMLVFRQFSVQ